MSCSIVYSFTLLLFYSFTLLLFYSFTLLLFYSFTRLLAYSLTRLLAYSLTRLLAYSLLGFNSARVRSLDKFDINALSTHYQLPPQSQVDVLEGE
ncbi:TPA: hypothetical protein I7699_15665 [Vibrio vulnificus]|nr:hypothetical protein [Vibrio vulnificus]